MGLIGHLAGVHQVNILRNKSVLLIQKHRQDIAIIQVHKDILLLKSTLELGITAKDLTILKKCTPLLEEFNKDILRAQNELSYTGDDKIVHREIINSLIAINDTLPEHVQKIFELAQLGDWLAVDLRVKNQIQAFVERLDNSVHEISVEVRKEEVDYTNKAQDAEEKAVWAIIITAAGILSIAGLMAFTVTRSITVPLQKLDRGARAIASGDFIHPVEIKGDDELTLMGNSFNQMREELKELYFNLEQKVAERTRDLEKKNKELIETQGKLIESEKLNTISQVIVSLSHEINNPLTAVIGNVMLLNMQKDVIDKEELGDILKTTEQELKRIMEVMKKLKNLEKPTTKTYIGGVEMIDMS